MRLDQFNALTYEEALKDLQRCCGARRWTTQMVARRPFRSVDDVFAAADQLWATCNREDVLEAFRHHPKIGDVASLRSRFATTKQWAEGEQAGVRAAAEDVLKKLAAGNEAYEAKYGFIFIVCATGKSAEEMLALLEERLQNPPAVEVKIAAGEQAKITRIRLGKLLQEET
jgi:2-oxo-4-hydroxy-4-carboxy-5-ureidoimidazoline decarboxylase